MLRNAMAVLSSLRTSCLVPRDTKNRVPGSLCARAAHLGSARASERRSSQAPEKGFRPSCAVIGPPFAWLDISS